MEFGPSPIRRASARKSLRQSSDPFSRLSARDDLSLYSAGSSRRVLRAFEIGLQELAPAEIGVDHRDHEQREQRADEKAAHDHPANVLTALGAGAGGERKRHGAEHHGGGGHQDRT